jgi:hypothetical protein
MYLGQKFKAKIYLGSEEEKTEVIGHVVDLPTWGQVARCEVKRLDGTYCGWVSIHEDKMESV